MSKADAAEFFVQSDELPVWYQSLIVGIKGEDAADFTQFQQPGDVAVRQSAVLILFGQDDEGNPDVLILERAAGMRSHAGQPAFPGGGAEASDATPIETALREAEEEVRLDTSGVAVVATLPAMWLPPSGFVVTPVLGWWHTPGPIAVGDPAEVAAVHRVPLGEMLNPANRVKVTHQTGYVGAGFRVRGMVVWGFTGMLLDHLFAAANWDQPWQDGADIVAFDSLFSGSEYNVRTTTDEVV